MERRFFTNLLAAAAGIIITEGPSTWGPPKEPMFKITYWVALPDGPGWPLGPFDLESDAEWWRNYASRTTGKTYVIVTRKEVV